MRLIAADYQHAAHLLHRDVKPLVPCEVMESLAGTDAELHAMARAWRTRYATRPATEAGAPGRGQAPHRRGRRERPGRAGHRRRALYEGLLPPARYPRSRKPAMIAAPPVLLSVPAQVVFVMACCR
jgi:hypothetical protein